MGERQLKSPDTVHCQASGRQSTFARPSGACHCEMLVEAKCRLVDRHRLEDKSYSLREKVETDSAALAIEQYVVQTDSKDVDNDRVRSR
jgi:hypothetical protein